MSSFQFDQKKVYWISVKDKNSLHIKVTLGDEIIDLDTRCLKNIRKEGNIYICTDDITGYDVRINTRSIIEYIEIE